MKVKQDRRNAKLWLKEKRRLSQEAKKKRARVDSLTEIMQHYYVPLIDVRVDTAEVQRPGTEGPQAERPTTEVNQPEVQQPEVQQPEVVRPEILRPNIERPLVERPHVERPELPDRSGGNHGRG